MPVSERAKQFMPFAALKGFSEALLEKEKVIVPEKELSEDMYAELDRNYHRLEIGKRAEVVYYKEYEYVKMSGIVSRIDENGQMNSPALHDLYPFVPEEDMKWLMMNE